MFRYQNTGSRYGFKNRVTAATLACALALASFGGVAASASAADSKKSDKTTDTQKQNQQLPAPPTGNGPQGGPGSLGGGMMQGGGGPQGGMMQGGGPQGNYGGERDHMGDRGDDGVDLAVVIGIAGATLILSLAGGFLAGAAGSRWAAGQQKRVDSPSSDA